MKTIRIAILCLGVTTKCFSQSEVTAIRKTIEAEDIAFYTNPNRKAYMEYWAIKPDTRWVYSGLDGTVIMTASDLKTAIAKNQFPPADNSVCSFSNFVIKVNGTVGWATYDKKAVAPKGKTDYTHEFRGMEKIAGVWKIISASVHQYKPK